MRYQRQLKRYIFCLILLLCIRTANADISGIVFRDFNINGVKDAATVDDARTDIGVAGISITAYDSKGTSFTAISDSLGGYSIDASQGLSPFRVEFSNLPAGYYATANNSGVGTSGTTIQFVADGNVANVNLGINNPEDYSQANPQLVIPAYKPGNSGTSGLQKFSYDAPKTGDGSGIPESLSTGSGVETPVSLASPTEIGTVWGVAYQQSQNRLFTTAFLRRHAAMADGAGYVYIIDPATGLQGKFNLAGVTPSNANTEIEVGTVTRTLTGLSTDDNNVSGQLNRDLDAFAKVGKMSFGDADIDGTGNTLWVVNLFEKTLLAIDVRNPTASLNNATATALAPLVKEYSIAAMSNAPNCQNGEIRPWGLGFYRSQGYLGVVCDASGTGATLADLDAYVLRFDPTNPSAGFAATPALTFGLDYNRELSSVFSREAYFAKWNSWTDSWNTISNMSPAYLDATSPPNPVKPQVSHHMPLLSDIAFTDDGSMVVALLDRNGYMLGRQNLAPYAASPVTPRNALVEHMSSGDIIHACNINGAFVLEGTGGCALKDDGTGTTTQGTYSTPLPTAVVDDGPSNTGEFYHHDAYAAGAGHNEIGLGALAVQRGRNEVVATVYDPLGFNNPAVAVNTYGLNVNGLHYYNSSQGHFTNGYLLLKNDQSVSSAVNPSTDNWTFGKANALGDIELLTNPAPIEIGNRVWLDVDHNGIQDAGENGIEGVSVELRSGTTVLASVTTAADGTYYFSSASGTSTPSKQYGIAALQPNTAYTLKFPSNVSVAGKTYNLSYANAGNNTSIDSNASETGEVTIVATDIPSAGANNYSFDVGYSTVPSIDLEISKIASVNKVSAGETFTYTVQVKNNGSDTATGVEVTDKLPSSVSYANAVASQGTYTAATGVWVVGSLAKDITASLTITVTVH